MAAVAASVRVEVNPTQLNHGAYDADIQSALSLQNSHQPKGQISNGLVTADIVANDQISKPTNISHWSLATTVARGALSDVADVIDSAQNIRTSGYLNGKPAIVIIFRQPGANIIETVDRIRAELPFLHALSPDKTIVLDRTTTIRASVEMSSRADHLHRAGHRCRFPVSEEFARDPHSRCCRTGSLIATFAVMYLPDYSIDNLSLMALTISTGFVVDDAIVVIENISRHRKRAWTPIAAALQGAKEIGFTVFTISISLIAVLSLSC